MLPPLKKISLTKDKAFAKISPTFFVPSQKRMVFLHDMFQDTSIKAVTFLVTFKCMPGQKYGCPMWDG